MFVCPECGQRYERAGTCTNEGASLAAVTDPLLGSEIARYRLARVLGEGGMGRVYLAVQPAIGSRVAIKVLSDECSRSADLLERFFAEAKAVNLIRHEHIVSVLDLAVLSDGRPFIIMEFIEGHTLAHYVRNTHAPLGGVAQVMSEVLSGLAAAHHIGIVHRDLKPDNVLVTVEGHAKILDFGIAKLAPGMRADISPRTKTGALLGTPAYMAPEQISGAENSDARTDIYAAGVLLYEAVTGSVPFAGATLFDLMRAHLEHAPPPPRERRPDLPPALEQVILQALAKDPAHRFQSATAMAQALVHATANLPAEQWKPLSTRGGSRISMPGIGASTERQPRSLPQVSTDRDRPIERTPPEPHAPAFGSTAAAPYSRNPQRRRMGLVFGVLAGAAIATGGTLFGLAGRDKKSQPSVVAAPGSATTSPPAEPPPAILASAVAAPELVAPAQPAAMPAAPGVTRPPPPPTRRGSDPRGAPPMQSPPPRPPAQPAAPQPAQPVESSVKLGDNVHARPGVVISGQPATSTQPSPPVATAVRTKVSQPADYDPKRFDPVGYLPKALALARQLAPDARLTSFEFDPVFADGRVDLTTKGRDREYIFRSPARSALPLGHPRNVPLDRPCVIVVDVGAQQITATVRESEDCDARFVRHPKCRFAGVWKQALAAGIGNDLAARIGWLHDEQWFFDTDFAGRGGGVSSFPDRCP
jgi:serine/threonine protein kinase